MHAISPFVRAPRLIYCIAGLASVLLSYVAVFRSPVINPDAICYVESAAAMKMGLATAMHLCGQAKWPFFSILIYNLANITHLSYVNTAFLLDSLLSLVSILSFMAIVRFLNKSPQIFVFSAFVVLFSHEFNAVREYIVRDHGFWAFYLFSILCLLHYFKDRQMIFAWGWGLSAIIATLFRIEGIVFLTLIPFLSFWIKGEAKDKWSAYFHLNLLTLIAIMCIGLLWFIHGVSFADTQLGRLSEVQHQLIFGFSDIVQRFNAHAQILDQHILSQYANHDAKTVLALMIVAWFIFIILNNVSFIYAGLVIYAWSQKSLTTERQNHLILWAYLIINIGITFIFLVENMFLSKRYVLALSLTLMLWIPFAFDKLCENWPKRRNLVMGLCFLIIIYSLGGIIDFGYSKRYIREAGQWLEKHVPSDATIYSNDEQVMYYSQHFGESIFKKEKEFSELNIFSDRAWKNFDYIVIRTKKKEWASNRLELRWGPPIQEFGNKRGDKILIFRLQNSEQI